MVRVGVPVLACARCGYTTRDLTEMGRFFRLSHYDMGGGQEAWDICPECSAAFHEWIKEADYDLPR